MAIIKYAIAEDHKIFRQGLKLALSEDHKLKCIGEAGDGQELLQLLEKQAPDVVLIDIKMPGMGGIEAMEVVKHKYPHIKILILTMFDDEHFIIHLMEAGANGYLLKNAEPDEIKLAIHTVYENEYYFNDLVSTTMLKKIMNRTKVPARFNATVKLNDKEAEVLRLICQERTAAEIAKEIFLSPRTVEGIRATLLEKTGARNTAGLVLYAIKNGIYSS
jgi:DNA-binding NarL/FixJ family response regulator